MSEQQFKIRVQGILFIILILALLVVGYQFIPRFANALNHLIQTIIFWTGLIELLILIVIGVAIGRQTSSMVKAGLAFMAGYFVMLVSYHIMLPVADVMLTAMNITQHVQIIHLALILIWIFLINVMPLWYIVAEPKQQ